MLRSSVLAATVMRYISGCEVPGGVSQCMRKSRSLKFSSNDVPSSGQITTPAETMMEAVPATLRGAAIVDARMFV